MHGREHVLQQFIFGTTLAQSFHRCRPVIAQNMDRRKRRTLEFYV
jgi:hypothetical protein